MGRKGFVFLLVLVVQNYCMAAAFETMKRADDPKHVIYYCMRNGVKIVSDEPCYKHDAPEQSRRYVANPEKDAEFLKIKQDKAEAWQIKQDKKTRETEEKQAIHAQDTTAKDNKEKEAKCNLLHREKEDIKANQLRRNSDYLTKRHREVDDEIYNQKCGFR